MKSVLNNRSVGWRFAKYFYPHRKSIAIAALLAVFAGSMDGAVAYMVKHIYDDVFIKRDLMLLKVLPVAIVLLFSANGVLKFFSGILVRIAALSVVKTLREELYTKYQSLSMDFFTDTAIGKMVSNITNDLQLVKASVPSLVSIFRQPFTLFFLAVVAFYQNWQLALVSLVAMPLAVFPVAIYGFKVRRSLRHAQMHMGNLSSVLKENFSGIQVIKAFLAEDYETNRVAQRNQQVFDAYRQVAIYREASGPVVETLTAIVFAVVLFLGGSMTIAGKNSPGEFLSFIAAVGMMYNPLRRMNVINNAFMQALAGMDRVFEVLDKSPSVTESQNPVVLSPLKREIRFEDVWFKYGDEWVLKGVSFTIRAGENVALVGSSGAGKTTIVKLLLRFYDPTQGRITIDGKDIKDASFTSLRRMMGIVSQDVFLFDDSIKNNISYSRVDEPIERVVEAAKAANAHDFIVSLSNRYETPIGELGCVLSGGQKQRLSIARALLKDPPLLLLDEATSSLDSQSEAAVQEALGRLMKGRTTLVIAHRLTTIQDADRILVLGDGKILEEGSHLTLMKTGHEYARLYDTHFSNGID